MVFEWVIALVRWSLERPRLIALACLTLLLWGGLSARDMKFDLLPDLAPAETTIRTEAPGLAAEQVETLVTGPVETGLLAAPGVARVTSRSIQGLSSVTVRFVAGADLDHVRESISQRLSALASGLPDGVSPPRLAALTLPDAEVLQIGFTSERLDPMTLRDVVRWTVRPRLLAAPGVASVAIHGGETRRIEVRARPADLSDSDLGLLDVLAAVKRATSVAGAGFIDTPSQRVLIEPKGQTLTPADVGAGQIPSAGGDPVRIDDVADVVEAPAPALGDALVMGHPGVVADVARQYGANTLATTHAVEAALDPLRPMLAARGIVARTDLDRPATFATAAIRGVALDLGIGAALAAVALWLFLRDSRATLIGLAGVVLSLLAAVLALRAVGLTLNAMTLGGLGVGLAVAIDDAAIDVHNMVARLRDAEARHATRPEAVLAAVVEVRGPVLYATLAIILSLLPMLALKGTPGALLAPFAAAAAAASLASLVVAVGVTPALSQLFLRHIEPAPGPAPALARLKAIHGRILPSLCARPWPMLILAVLLAVLALVAFARLRPEALPSVGDGQLTAEIIAPPSSALAVSRDYGARIAAAVMRIGGVRSISQTIGRDDTADDSWGPERSVFAIGLSPGLDRAAQRRIADAVLARLNAFPGLGPTVGSRFDLVHGGGGQGREEPGAPIRITIFGQDLDALDGLAARVAAVVGALPGARDVRVEARARAPAIRVDINFQRLALYGLSSADVLATVQAAFAGETVATLHEDERVVDLAVSAQASLRRDPEAVGDLLLRSPSGISVPLKAVANVYLTDDRQMIAHDGGLRRQVVTARATDPDRFISLARQAIATRVAGPQGSFIDVGAGDEAAGAARGATGANYALALLGVFALLAIAFDGRTGALILTSSLMALAGGVAAATALGGVLSFGAMAGLIALFGLSMRAAILLFDRLEDLLLAERAPWSPGTIALAAFDRLGPQLMTSLLVALTLLPLALHAGGAGREVLGPMATVVICGLFTGTLGALLLLPVLIYALWRPAWARRARKRRPGG